MEMNELVKAFVLYFTSFISLVNPLGVMPVFLAMSASLTPKERRHTAVKATITAIGILFVFALGGQLLFQFFGLSVHGFRIVGGIIFFIMGFDMLNARLSRIKLDTDKVDDFVNDISITPLAIPLLAGPGVITNAIVLMEDTASMDNRIVLILAIVVSFLVTLALLLGASGVIRVLGETGIKVMMKLMGLIVMVIAVEFFFAGLGPILQSILMIGG